MQHKALFPFLQYNPLNIFLCNKTPAALYARRKWLQQHETPRWRNDFRETVSALFSGQLADGSWDDSIIHTIHKLFGLHLTIRHKDVQIEKGLNWLLSQKAFIEEGRISLVQPERVSSRNLHSLPFSAGCPDHFVKGASLFLATIFGLGNDSRVIRVYKMLRNIGEKRNGKWCTWPCSNNILRAFIVHPEYAKSRVIRMYVTKLAKIQKTDGSWPKQIPFYQTVNALGHLNFKQSDSSLKRAFVYLKEKQNKDGTWGRTQKDWNTFLIVHAVTRKRSLFSM
jgi:hypothetical protein